jgi:predicted RNA methylase
MINTILRLYKAGGLKRVQQEILNFLFDIFHNVETRKRIENSNIKDAHDYMPSYQKSVSQPLNFLKKRNFKFEELSFIDIGCGKGKTLLIAAKYGFSEIYGYEINSSIFKVLDLNITKSNISNLRIFKKSIDIEEIQNKSVIYFYNPFGETLTLNFFSSIAENKNLKDIVIIYVNPIYSKFLENDKWTLIYKSNISTQGINIWLKNE